MYFKNNFFRDMNLCFVNFLVFCLFTCVFKLQCDERSLSPQQLKLVVLWIQIMSEHKNSVYCTTAVWFIDQYLIHLHWKDDHLYYLSVVISCFRFKVCANTYAHIHVQHWVLHFDKQCATSFLQPYKQIPIVTPLTVTVFCRKKPFSSTERVVEQLSSLAYLSSVNSHFHYVFSLLCIWRHTCICVYMCTFEEKRKPRKRNSISG